MEVNFHYPDTHDEFNPLGGNSDALDAKFAAYNSKYAIVLTGARRPSGMPAARYLVCLAKHNSHARWPEREFVHATRGNPKGRGPWGCTWCSLSGFECAHASLKATAVGCCRACAKSIQPTSEPLAPHPSAIARTACQPHKCLTCGDCCCLACPLAQGGKWL